MADKTGYDMIGDGGLDATTRKCPDCGQLFTGETHAGCPGPKNAGGTAGRSAGGSFRRDPGATSRLDDLPAEARVFDEDPTRQLNQYVLVKQIGRGGMGAVWKAWDRKLTRWVAVKFLLAAEDEDIARFQREAKLAARLRHPNIAPIYEVGEAPAREAGQQARYYLAMEFIDGQSLASVELPIRDAVDIFLKVVRGVEAAHKTGVIHRDLKPANVMLTSDRWPYVMDFGLAKSLQTESSLSVSGAVMGTPAYMPPEQAQGRVSQVDASSDVYSLGATLYAVLCRKPPFEGESAMDVVMKTCNEDPAPPRTINPEIPEALERIILKAMAKVKEDRYATAGEMADDLQRYLADETVEAKVPVRKKRRGLWLALAGAAVLAVIGVSVLSFIQGDPPEPAQPIPKPAPPTPPDSGTSAGGGSEKPPPDPGPTADELLQQRQQVWRNAWAPLRLQLDFPTWKPGAKDVAAQAREVLGRMAAEAAAADAIGVSDWARKQVELAGTTLDDTSGTPSKRRDRAGRVAAWCQAFLAATREIQSLRSPAATANGLFEQAQKDATYRGRFTLRIFVGPYAEIRSCQLDGKPVQLPATHTPLVAKDLAMGNYELVLAHPQHGEKRVKIEEAELQDGGGLRVSGQMQDKTLSKTVE